MSKTTTMVLAAALLISSAWAQAATVTLTLTSSKSGQTVAPGTTVDWTISASLSASDNAGLALACTDLIQGTTNASFFDLTPAGGVPGSLANFSRPLGVSNPGESGATTGYIGVQRSPTGQTYKNLIQIGGAQNTFGSTLPAEQGVAQSAVVVPGLGQGGTAQVIASGSITAPATNGTYTFQLQNAIANVLENVSPQPTPPAFWPVAAATVDISTASFSIVVHDILRGDVNCDGVVSTADITHFVQALVDPTGYDADHDGSPYAACTRNNADMNVDSREDGLDIRGFVEALLGS